MRARFFVEWDSGEELEKLRKRAVAKGMDVVSSDDWYQPEDIVEIDDEIEPATLARAVEVARMHLHDAHHGEVRVFENVGDLDGWDWDSVQRETVR